MIRARALIVTAALLAAACAPSTATTGASDGSAPGGVNGTENLPNNEIVDPNPHNAGTAMPSTAEEATAQDTCGAARFHHLIGTTASAIDRATLPPATRIITPGMMVTQDFSPQRLNIFTGVDGKVSSMRCF